jgi:hypothetical protein
VVVADAFKKYTDLYRSRLAQYPGVLYPPPFAQLMTVNTVVYTIVMMPKMQRPMSVTREMVVRETALRCRSGYIVLVYVIKE